MGQVAQNQKVAFNQSEAMLNLYEKKLLGIYRGSLKQIRSDLMKLNEKAKWSFSELSKYNRLDKLKTQIANEIRKLGRQSAAGLARTNTNIVTNTYNRSWFGYEKEIQTSLAFGKINPELVQGIVTEPYPDVKLSDLVKGVTQQTANRISFEIGQSLTLGEGAAKMAQRIKNTLNISYNRAVTIARTEGLRASSKAQLVSTQRSQDLGIDIVKVWDSTNDSRTRPSHVSMEGQKANTDGLFTLVSGKNRGAQAEAPRLFGIAEEDINCRCTYIEEVDDIPENIEKRVTPASKNKYKQLTFKEWEKERL